MTFMNNSGESVRALAQQYRVGLALGVGEAQHMPVKRDHRDLDSRALLLNWRQARLHGPLDVVSTSALRLSSCDLIVAYLPGPLQIPVSRILVISDDLDQPTAGIKLKPKGGHGGHNGLRSIMDCVGRSDFPRLKIGIGRPPALVPVPT